MQGALVSYVLRQLVTAWGSAQANGDAVRANAVLAVFAQIYNRWRPQLLEWAVTVVSDASALSLFPARATGAYGAATRAAMQAALVVGAADAEALLPVAEAMPANADAIGAWYRDALAPRFTLGARWAELLAGPANTLAGTLGQLAQETIMSASSPSVPATTTPGPEIDVYGNTGRWTMPTWGWWALGLGLATAVGYTGYRVWKKR